MPPLLFENARIFDDTNSECAEGIYLRVANGLIQEVSARPITDKDARLIADKVCSRFGRPRRAERGLETCG